jgi:hypothetical protein
MKKVSNHFEHKHIYLYETEYTVQITCKPGKQSSFLLAHQCTSTE